MRIAFVLLGSGLLPKLRYTSWFLTRRVVAISPVISMFLTRCATSPAVAGGEG